MMKGVTLDLDTAEFAVAEALEALDRLQDRLPLAPEGRQIREDLEVLAGMLAAARAEYDLARAAG